MRKLALILLFLTVPIDAQIDNNTPEYIFPDETPVKNLLNWKVAFGDSSHWRESNYNDSSWQDHPGLGLWRNEGESGKGVRWYRKTIFLPHSLDSFTVLALYQVAIVSANEIFWDGTLISRNGIPAHSRDKEQTGKSGQIVIVPRTLTAPGKHVIALRVSNYHTFSGLVEAPLQLGYFYKIHKHLFRVQGLSIFLAGIFILAALFHFAILSGRGNRWPYALFGTFCLSCAFYILIRGLLRYFQIDVIYYYPLAAINDIPWFLMMVLLPIFFLFEFNSPFKKRVSVYIGISTLLLTLFPRLITYNIIPIKWLNLFDRANQFHIYFTLLVSIAVSMWALYNKKKGGLGACIGLIIFLIGVYFSNRANVENGWAIGFVILNIFLTISLSKQMAQKNRLHQEAQLRSARLEIELLKKHIQPHFLLNSLNSIVAWLEEDPPTAAKLVNAFADELRMLLEFSKKKLLLLSDEILLCKTHLRVMSLRHEKKYTLSVRGFKGDEQLPPLVIHTLVENGLTHGYKGKDSGSFILTCIHHKKDLEITLFNDSVVEKEYSIEKEGTGIRYVKTRLEEAFPSAWSLESRPVSKGWEVTILLQGALT